MHSTCLAFFFFLLSLGGGGVREEDFFFSLFPGSQCVSTVPFKFPVGFSSVLQYVRRVPNVFPNMFSIASPFFFLDLVGLSKREY
jgi:hypothetical protein